MDSNVTRIVSITMPDTKFEVENVRVLWKAPNDSGPVSENDFQVEKIYSLFRCESNQILCKTLFLSIDPYLRYRMKSKGIFIPSFEAGKPLAGRGLARVVGSCSPNFKEGDVFLGSVPWEKYFVAGPEQISNFRKVDTNSGFPLYQYLNGLGLVGMTSYAAFAKVIAPQPGEVAYVSAAAGSVGLIAGQLLKNVYKCRVVGSTGSDEKVARLVNEFGFDAAFNYHTQDVNEALKQHCPGGIDLYFDNVGGPTLEAAIDNCKDHARILECGHVSQYDNEGYGYGVRNTVQVVFKRLRIQGFTVLDWEEELRPKFLEDMQAWLKEGTVRTTETITYDLQNAGKAFVEMMKGGNIGKALVQVED